MPAKWHLSAKFKCVGSLGWDISVSYHVLQLLSSLTSRSNAAVPETGRSQLLNLLYQAIILRTTLFSKERFTKWKIGGWIPVQFKCVGSQTTRLGYLRFLPCLAAAFELDIQIHCSSWNGKVSYWTYCIMRLLSAPYYPAKKGSP